MQQASFSCLFQNQPGLLKFQDGEFSFQATSRNSSAGLSFLSLGVLANVKSVVSNKFNPQNPTSRALRVTMKVPVGKVFDFKGFESDELRESAKQCLTSSETISRSVSPVPLPTTTTPSTPVAPGQNNSGLPSKRQLDPLPFDTTGKNLPSNLMTLRLEVLKRNDKIRNLHEKLVRGKIISEDDFWVGKEALLSEQQAITSQQLGLASSSVLDPTEEEVTKSVVLNKDMISRIFMESPSVKQKYDQLVPVKLSEEEFWTTYLHSRYVLGSRRNVDFAALRKNLNAHTQTRNRNEDKKRFQEQAKDLFGSVELHRLEFRKTLEAKFQERMRAIDPEVNLQQTFEEGVTSTLSGLGHAGYGIFRRQGEGLVSKSAQELARSLVASNIRLERTKEKMEELRSAVKDDPLLTTINERANLAVGSVAADLRSKRLKEDLQQELRLDGSLDAEPEHKVDALVLKPPPVLAIPSFQEEGMDDGFVELSRSFDPTFALPVGPERKFVFPPPQVQMQSQEGFSLSSFPPDVLEVLLLEVRAVEEYCRHFWASLHNVKKCGMIVEKMKETKLRIEGGLREVIRTKAPQGSFLIKVPLAQLDRAMEEYSKVLSAAGMV